MSGWVILVDQLRDFPNAETPHKVITTADYLARPKLFEGQRPKIVNLARSYAYQSQGYYASLLAEARGHRVLPPVEAMLELRERPLYVHAIPSLEDDLNDCARKAGWKPAETTKLLVCFGYLEDESIGDFEDFGKALFDWFHVPAIEVTVEPGEWLSIEKIRARTISKVDDAAGEFFRAALHRYTQRAWRSPKTPTQPKYWLAVLHDPTDKLSPTSTASLKHFARIAEKSSLAVEPITRRQLSELAEYDALFIRETTSIDNHTYRFARRAVQNGMPVIDDPVSMIRCTNKVYLMELLGAEDLPMPPTVMLADEDDLEKAADTLGFPLVVKVPDGSFSRGVHKVADLAALKVLTDELFEETDLLLAQKFMPTSFDWRIGVLGGKPLFACQYMMARGHWQIIKHGKDGSKKEGSHRTVAIEEAPKKVIDYAVRAARKIGDGLYGVDVKETPDGIYIIEVNDNPNLDHGVEDMVGKDQVWQALVDWFVKKIEG